MDENPSSEFNPYAPPLSPLQSQGGDVGEALRPVPFEDLEAMPGFWKRVGATFGLAFKKPMEFFERVPVTEGLGAPLRFQFLLTAPMGLFVLLMVVFLLIMGYLSGGASPDKNAPPPWFFGAMGGAYAVAVPIGLLASYFIGGPILHFLLWIWGGLRNGREVQQTMRATGYFLAFFTLASCIPCLNYIIPLVAPVPLGMGLARLHRTDTWRAICAAYTPILFCCLFYAGIFGVLFATGAMK
jgi:hypothetical protein